MNVDINYFCRYYFEVVIINVDINFFVDTIIYYF